MGRLEDLEARVKKLEEAPKTTVWRGIWVKDTKYLIGDILSAGSQVFICKQAHTSEDPGNNSPSVSGGMNYWVKLAGNWRGIYEANITYLPDDMVREPGKPVYLCIQATRGRVPAEGDYWVKVGA